LVPIGLAQNPASGRRLGETDQIAYAPSLSAQGGRLTSSKPHRPARSPRSSTPQKIYPPRRSRGRWWRPTSSRIRLSDLTTGRRRQDERACPGQG
jgi:hypothetical protein